MNRTSAKCLRHCKHAFAVIAFLLGGGVVATADAAILQVQKSTLSGVAGADFEDLNLANGQQVTFNSIFESGNTSFGESFAGQTVTTSGNFDVLSGTPTGPLTLVVGGQSTNVTAIDGGAGDIGNTAIAGSGPLGYPNPDAVGEGAIAILFDFDQSEFGMDIVGGNGGTATAQFWARDGSLLDALLFNLTSAIFQSFGFKTGDGAKSIAGVSIFNNDLGGIGFDNFIFDVAGVPGTPGQDGNNSVPEPSTMALLGLGWFVGIMARRRAAA